ncbi:MAG TPA: aminoglycoside phosphotransferase family protein, partial [Herpetosiphonaceae bacterium]
MTTRLSHSTATYEPLGSRGTVRVGNTVRRQRHASSRPIHALLEHLRSVGFLAVPDVLGIDDDGRDVLSWVEGDAGVEPISPDVSSDQALVAVAGLIRRFHDATTTFRWEHGGWNSLLADPSGRSEVICHNDLSTHNIVYRRTNPVAIIDWEFATPGSRLWDLAYACVWFVPLHSPEHCASAGWGIVDQARRLRLFCDSYGLGS